METASCDDASPMTEIALGLGETKLSSIKRKISYSPKNKISLKPVQSPHRSPLSSLKNILPSKSSNNTLLQSGLRVSTPPGRCGRRFILDENSPLLRSPSTYTVVVRQRNLLLEDSDTSSQDSAISEGPFRFLQPSGFAPKRTESPRRCLQFSCENLSTLSSDSGISEDGFTELPPPDDNSSPLPPTYGSLIQSGNMPTPKSRKRRSTAFSAGAKRPKPLSDRASEENVSAKGTLFQYGFTKEAKPLTTSASDSELNIKLALQRSMKEVLIGDFTRPFALPLMSGKHEDLKTINSDTLANLINGEYDDKIESFKIIDCRYPYEYAGGHIKGAVNLFTCEHILKDLLEMKPNPQKEGEEEKRNILVFHCEFSSERGPYLSRFLRKEDRASHDYPQLAYPELYLLHGGYKAFFEQHKELCVPQSYRTMQDPAHSSEYKHFRAKSKSWAPGSSRKLAIRSLSRLNF